VISLEKGLVKGAVQAIFCPPFDVLLTGENPSSQRREKQPEIASPKP
jgi:G:T/U-mismatch repair DNA glycosylase